MVDPLANQQTKAQSFWPTPLASRTLQATHDQSPGLQATGLACRFRPADSERRRVAQAGHSVPHASGQ